MGSHRLAFKALLIVFCWTVSALRGLAEGNKCSQPVDVGFLIDGSENAEGFKKCLNFVSNTVQRLEAFSNHTRVGVVVSSTDPEGVFRFGQYTTSQAIRKINHIGFPGGGGKSGKALDFCSHYLFDESDKRKKVLIVLTNGRSDDDVQQKAHSLKLKGVQIYSLGVGEKTNEAQLLQIASGPKFMFPSGLKLSDNIISRIKQAVCRDEDKKRYRRSPFPGRRRRRRHRGRRRRRRQRGRRGRRPAPMTPLRTLHGNFGRVCKTRVDIGFLIDGSGSIEHYGRGNFRRCLNFVWNVVHMFQISRSSTRIGVEVFSSRARLQFSFGQANNERAVYNKINGIRYPSGGTRTGRALDYARRTMFKRSRGRKKVLIVMTDGRSQDRVSAPARRLKRSGVTLFALGIGRHFNRGQLNHIASRRQYVFAARFRQMRTVIRIIKQKTCRLTGTPQFTILDLFCKLLRIYKLLVTVLPSSFVVIFSK